MRRIILFAFLLTIFAACQSKTAGTKDELASTPDTLQTIFKVERMTCDHCEMTVEGSVKELAGIVSVKANFEDSTTIVKYDASKVTKTSIAEVIEKKGYKVAGEIK